MASPELRLCIPIDAGQLEASRERVRMFLRVHGVDEQSGARRSPLRARSVRQRARAQPQHDRQSTSSCVWSRRASPLSSPTRAWDSTSTSTTRGARPTPLQPDGRGLYVMACLMDELEVHIDGGTVIRMRSGRRRGSHATVGESICDRQNAVALHGTDPSEPGPADAAQVSAKS